MLASRLSLCRLLIAVTISTAATLAFADVAAAQAVAVVVNGDPITDFDIQQRAKLTELSTHKMPPRSETIEELIGEKLKLQLLKRFMLDGIDKDVDTAMTNMARRMHVTSKEFLGNLEKQGVKAETLRSRVKADIIWSQIVRGRYQSAFQFSDADIAARIAAKRPADAAAVGYNYTLRPILFIVPRGSPQTAFDERMKEAESLRGRFQSCDDGLGMARAIRFVAVRPPVTKGSADLASALRDVLDKTELGHLTPPEVTQQGVETYAVCAKKKSDDGPAKKEMRDEMYNEAFEAQAKKLMKEIRDQAMIEYR